MKITINDLKNGGLIKIDNDPYMIVSVKHLHMGRGGSSVQTKIRNLKTGKVFDRNYKPADEFEDAEVEKMKSRFLYESRGIYWFNEVANPKNRFSFTKDDLGEETVQFLKVNMEVVTLRFEEKPVSIDLPIKVDYEVIDAPPSIKGNTAQGGNKVVIIEGGAKISTPMFVEIHDLIKVNTQTGEYVERVSKI